jgi:hypothetical protein
VKRVKRKKWSSSSQDLDMSSKHPSLHSLQIHHIMQRGTIFQTTTLFERPPIHQLAYNSLTVLGITQQRPNLEKKAFHKALEALQ